MKASNYIKNDCDQETAKEYSTIVQIIVKDDRGKAISWRSVSSVRCHVITYQTKNSTNSQSAILYPVCGLQSASCNKSAFLPGLQSAFFADQIGIAVFVRASLKSGPKYWGSKRNFSETILAAMIDVWTVCWRAPGDKHNDRAIITLYQLRTNANARLNNMVASDTLLRGYSVCWNEFDTGPPGVNISASRFIKPYKHFISFRASLWASSKLIWLLLGGEG